MMMSRWLLLAFVLFLVVLVVVGQAVTLPTRSSIATSDSEED
jgi:hypothetical protein